MQITRNKAWKVSEKAFEEPLPRASFEKPIEVVRRQKVMGDWDYLTKDKAVTFVIFISDTVNTARTDERNVAMNIVASIVTTEKDHPDTTLIIKGT